MIKKPCADGKSTVRAVTSPAALTVEVPWLLQTNYVVVSHPYDPVVASMISRWWWFTMVPCSCEDPHAVARFRSRVLGGFKVKALPSL